MYNYHDNFPCFRQMSYQQPSWDQMLNQSGSVAPMYPLPEIGTTFPTGIPTGPSYAPMPGIPSLPPAMQQPPETITNILFTPGYLKTQIGRKVRMEFLIGTNGMTDRIGTLVGVGTSYVLLRLEETDDIMLGDIYSIKFATFYH